MKANTRQQADAAPNHVDCSFCGRASVRVLPQTRPGDLAPCPSCRAIGFFDGALRQRPARDEDEHSFIEAVGKDTFWEAHALIYGDPNS